MKKSTRRLWFDGDPPLALVILLWAACLASVGIALVAILIGR